MSRFAGCSIASLCLLALGSITCESIAADKPEDAKHESVANDKKTLMGFQVYVGGWKGVGQTRRGSSQGAWVEEAQWAWHFTDQHAELAADISDGRYFSAMRLQAGAKPGQFRLVGTVAAGGAAATGGTAATGKDEERFEGEVASDGKLVLSASDDHKPDRPARITLHLVADGNRLVVLYERKDGNQFARLAEVGYTRKGSAFAVKGVDPHECIVTGGHGTIAVEYKGNTYYFCCTGCRGLFEQDPEGVLAEYRQRKAKEQAAGGSP
jgi:YHS domain-containing protein